MIGGVLPSNARLLGAFESMDVAALILALDDIAAAGLLTADRELLERHLAKLLIFKDPETGFSRFCVPSRGEWSFILGALFSDWVQRDPDLSVAWLRRHLVEGGTVFDRMISEPFFTVLGDDPALSASILAVLPENKRLESLRGLGVASLLEPDRQPEWARILRANLPDGDRLKAIAWPLGNWSDGDGSPMLLAEVDAYLERIEATSEERHACVLQVATQRRSWRDSHREEPAFADGLERMRAWVGGQSPELVAEATLRALEYEADFGSFAEASEIAILLHEETGAEAYLHAVLKDVHRTDEHENVRRILDRVTDEARLEQYREQIR
jgi:hypothetical protein